MFPDWWPSLLLIAVTWLVWALWPAHHELLVGLGSAGQRALLHIKMLGLSVTVRARSAPASREGEGEQGTGCGRGRRIALSVRVRLLRFLTFQKRFPAMQLDWHGGHPLLWLWETWSVWVSSEKDSQRRDGVPSRALLGRARRGPAAARLAGIARRLHVWRDIARRGNAVLRRHMVIRRWEVHVCLGSRDAAVAGWLTGAVWALWGVGSRGLGQTLNFQSPPVLRVRPEFNRSRFTVRFTARASIRQGRLAQGGMLMLAYWLGQRAHRLRHLTAGRGAVAGRV